MEAYIKMRTIDIMMQMVHTVVMRTTMNIDSNLLKILKREANERGITLSALIEIAAKIMLANADPKKSVAPFKLITVRGERPPLDIDLDRTSNILITEDEQQLGVPKGKP